MSLWRLSAVLFVTVGVVALSASVRVAEIVLIVAQAGAVWATLRAARTGRGPAGVSRLLPIGLMGWLIGHVIELATLSSTQPQIGPADAFFTLVVALLVVAAGPVLVRSATYVNRTVLLRTTLDSVMIGSGVLVCFWQWLAWPVWLEHGPPMTIGVVLSTAYAGLSALLAGVAVTRAWQRGDLGSWLLAASVVLCVAGVLLWSAGKLGYPLRLPGLIAMIAGVVVLPWAIGHPDHQRPVTYLPGDERDRLGSLGFHLAAWALVAVAGLRADVPSRFTTVLALIGLALMFARVYVVRRSEQALWGQLRSMAFTDPLTGLGNRRALLAELSQPVDGWLITLDLDGFKRVNDELGHDAGDDVLRAIARRLDDLAGEYLPVGRRRPLVARIGGDEFAAVLRCDEHLGVEFAHEVVRNATDDRYPWVTGSVGLVAHRSGTDPTTSLRDADFAMRESKRLGKNRVSLLTEELLGQQLRELEIASRLRTRMSDIAVVYQPIVAIGPGAAERPAVAAVEALARWQDADLGEVPPAEFVPVCERNGLIAHLGETVLDAVLAQVRVWQRQGAPRQVSVNVSWLQLRDRVAVSRMVDRLVADHDLAPWLVLEVTESVFAQDDAALAAVARLRSLGVSIAVDDFGAGAATLTRLRGLPADVLKVDRTLVTGLPHDHAAASVLEMVVALGDALGLAVVVEGVEDEETADLVAQLGFRYAQGFHFGRPMPPAQVPVSTGPGLPRRVPKTGGPAARRGVPAARA